MGELNIEILIQALEEQANLRCGDNPTFPHKISTEFADYLNSMKWWLGNAMPKHDILQIAKTTEIQQFALSSLAYSSTKKNFITLSYSFTWGRVYCCGTDFGVTWLFEGISFPSTMRVLLHLCLLSHLIDPAHYHLKTYTWHISCLITGERNAAGRGQKEYKQASLVSLPPFKFYPLCTQPILTQLSICEQI